MFGLRQRLPAAGHEPLAQGPQLINFLVTPSLSDHEVSSLQHIQSLGAPVTVVEGVPN